MTTKKKSRRGDTKPLPVLRPKVAGVDIGSREHMVCGPALDDGTLNVRAFGTTTAQLEALWAWLVEQQVVSVVMESTSVYWIPLYELLESRGIECVLVNARQLHNVPGRKTDVSDCQWLQTLHSCGLLRGSFRPSDAIVRLRALHRHMGNLVRERTRCLQWMQKALDQMNVQVHRAVSDISGDTGLAIMRAIVAGERDPVRLAQCRDRRCRKSEAEIAAYLTGTWREEHVFVLQSALQLFDALEQQIATLEERLLAEMKALEPPERREAEVPRHPNAAKAAAIRSQGDQAARTTLWRLAGVDLMRIDGIAAASAKVILTEVGTNLAAFPTEHHFVSWLRLCPRTPISGGKPLKKRPNGLGANRVAAVLRMAATSVQRSKTAIGAAYRRIARHRGAPVAIMAIARKLAQLTYRMLRFGDDYVDIGQTAYEQRFEARRLAALHSTAKSLGYALIRQEAIV